MNQGTKRYPTVLSIAGSDPSGGAGIQADIKTCTTLGCYAMTAITALTAQNTIGVSGVLSMSRFLRQQLEAVMSDITPDAVKIGMIPDEDAVEAIADAFSRHNPRNIIIDPVMSATSGTSLSSAAATDAVVRRLISLASVITPNIPEASRLVGHVITSIDHAEVAAREIADRYRCNAVLIKGGHLDRPVDILYERDNDEISLFHGRHIDTRNSHGTGCTLSSAIACGLAKGIDLKRAVADAKRFVTAALEAGADYIIGHGNGAMNHLFNINTTQWK